MIGLYGGERYGFISRIVDYIPGSTVAISAVKVVFEGDVVSSSHHEMVGREGKEQNPSRYSILIYLRDWFRA